MQVEDNIMKLLTKIADRMLTLEPISLDKTCLLMRTCKHAPPLSAAARTLVTSIVHNTLSQPGRRPFVMLSIAHLLLLMDMPELSMNVCSLIAPFDQTLSTRGLEEARYWQKLAASNMSIHDDYETAMQVDDVSTKESCMTDGQAKELYQVFWYKYSDRSSTSCITGSVDVLMLGFKPPCCECSITAPEDVPLTETVCYSLCGRHHWLECFQRACARRRLKLPLRNKGKNKFWVCKECRQRFKCDEVADSWTQIIIQLL